ncbi:hypothetical protein Ciccas_011512 [Cichlidogyrus casuarinus]|uniref:Uracil-DNA glycosylase n=1 Tax=Cichlidogyrus casuarinus TaxID=1844966 RepID=A0ABD2PR13_9PLAT
MSKRASFKGSSENKRITDFFGSKIPKLNETHDTASGENSSPSNELAEKLKSNTSVANLINGLSDHWANVLQKEILCRNFTVLSTFIQSKRNSTTVYPPADQVFSWSLTPINQIKVVILGQDPYHGPNQAHGLAFSVKNPTPPPPSLVNIFKEVSNSMEKSWPNEKVPKTGDLTSWSKQGVLLLNAVLTVERGLANSHQNKGWESLTSAVIAHLNTKQKNIVFMLWGSSAHKQGADIDTNNHLVLRSVHPSPLSAHRGFLGCNHFKLANDYLINKGREPIDWMQL